MLIGPCEQLVVTLDLSAQLLFALGHEQALGLPLDLFTYSLGARGSPDEFLQAPARVAASATR
jgi:hypothetical protein